MKASITGIHGFIGSALSKRLKSNGVEVFNTVRKDVDVVYLFGSPSSNILFDENIDKCFSDTINSFLDAIRFCRDHKIKLVYPSSATVYNKNTHYARCKSILEEIHNSYGGDVLGLRIFAGYGPGEAHKGRYASVVYQFCKDMKNGKNPIVYGDGTQTRDFIYIDDIVDSIIDFTYSHKHPIEDVGTGENYSFNYVIDNINELLNTNITPFYIDKPKDYIKETPCSKPIKKHISLVSGIRLILETL